MVGRHAARSRRAALTALGALVLTALPAAASAAPPPAPGRTAGCGPQGLGWRNH
ncbi:hypothetical protein ACFC5X_27610 [Streptomyces sp. NPDC055952]|uniref:hypothetical protein n=1 Tax=Streptomyces sp. NPDC055952 TaxID=3345663 RepID=UPI0035D998A4